MFRQNSGYQTTNPMYRDTGFNQQQSNQEYSQSQRNWPQFTQPHFGMSPQEQPAFNTPEPRNPKISNYTSANDPKSVHSRVFVGNLNTSDMTKEDVANIFCHYGKIEAISKHKGYAFVQFTNVFEARKAVAGEDQMVYKGMKIDCNIVTEPKNKQGTKRPAIMSTDRSTQRATGAPSARTLVTLGGDGPSTKKIKSETGNSVAKHSKDHSSNDILICGNCKDLFSSLDDLTAHKQTGCQLKFSCKCKDIALRQEPSTVLCATCSTVFKSSWDLCVHCQQEHGLSIYKQSGDNGTLSTADAENDEDSVLNLESDGMNAKEK